MNQDSRQADDSPITLINVFEVPAEHADAFVAGWRERAALMSAETLTAFTEKLQQAWAARRRDEQTTLVEQRRVMLPTGAGS